MNPEKLQKLARLQEQFAASLPEKISAIKHRWHQLDKQAPDQVALADLLRQVHTLAGSAGTFCFRQLGQDMLQLESLLRQLNPDEPLASLLASIEDGILKLPQTNIADTNQTGRRPQHRGLEAEHRQPLVYFLSGDGARKLPEPHQMGHFGYQVKVYEQLPALSEAIRLELPDAVVADIDQLPLGHPVTVNPSGIDPGGPIPVVYVSDDGGWSNRLHCLRFGGQAFLTKPLDPLQLVELLDGFTGQCPTQAYRVLVVEDDHLLAEHYASVLAIASMETRAISNPALLLDLLPEFCPDLILMDVYMQDCSGIEAAQVVRQIPGYHNVPIVYLSNESDLQRQLQALKVGGDEFLQKPISDEHLVEAVNIRARRFRQLSALMTRDSLTGLLNHSNLKMTLERCLAQAKRSRSTLCFAMLDIDHFKSINDRYGHPAGDHVIRSLARLLQQRLRKSDIAARYGGEEFAIILVDTGLEEAVALLDSLRQQFVDISFSDDDTGFSASFSAGVVQSTAEINMSTLIESTDQCLYLAKRRGRNRIERLC